MIHDSTKLTRVKSGTVIQLPKAVVKRFSPADTPRTVVGASA